MKSYDETMESILEKSGAVLRARARRRKAAVSTLTASAALAAVVLLCYPAVQTLPDGVVTGQSSAVSEVQDTEQDTEQDADGGDADADPDIDADTDSESAAGAVAACDEATDEKVSVRDIPGNEIHINEVSEELAGGDSYASLPLLLEHYNYVDRGELLAYYGIAELDLSSALDNYNEVENMCYIYDDGSGKEWDNYEFEWEDTTGTKFLRVQFAHVATVVLCDGMSEEDAVEAVDKELETSTLNGVEMTICSYRGGIEGYEDNVYLKTGFVLNGISVSVHGVNMDEDDFLAAVAYLTELDIE